MPKNEANKRQKDCLGIWTFQSTVLYAYTDVYLDLKDICKRFFAVVPLGKFEDSYFYFSSLEISIPVIVDMLISFFLFAIYFILWVSY